PSVPPVPTPSSPPLPGGLLPPPPGGPGQGPAAGGLPGLIPGGPGTAPAAPDRTTGPGSAPADSTGPSTSTASSAGAPAMAAIPQRDLAALADLNPALASRIADIAGHPLTAQPPDLRHLPGGAAGRAAGAGRGG